MGVFTKEILLKTRGECDVRDITPSVQEVLSKSGLREGSALVFAAGSTAGVSTCEFEPGLVEDIKIYFEKLFSKDASYKHNAAWEDGNGHSHLRATFLGPSLSVPFVDGALCLGTWQQIVFIDFDNRPRDRKVIVQVRGEV